MPKRTLIAIAVAALVLAGVYAYQYEGVFRIEFGDFPETREAFGAMLTAHHISYHAKTDHLGRVWVVPDRSKRREFDVEMEEWEAMRRDEVRKRNEARGYNE